MIKRCPHCNSIWVCWNWIHQTKEKMNKFNPGRFYTHDYWGHECWDCDSCISTDFKVKNGIPHWILIKFYKLFKRK